jgi:hypothetical protein
MNSVFPVILSEVAASPGEAAAKSKDPYSESGAKDRRF